MLPNPTPLDKPWQHIWINAMNQTFTEKEQTTILAAKAAIKVKFNDFNLTIGKLGKTFPKAYFVSGGCIASLLQGGVPNDWDVWFYGEEFAQRVKKLYTEDPSYQNEVATMEEKYRDVIADDKRLLVTENATTLKNGIQIITKYYGSPEEVRKTFDYVHCLPYYDAMQDKLYISRDQYDCCNAKILKVNNLDNLKEYRRQKFLNRGYTEWPLPTTT
jgi:hypothetical protein